MTPHEIRVKFLEFFKQHNHSIEPSDALVPSNDPTLLFTTAGMVQFKSLYAGAPLKFDKAATVQKCLRAGGKDSDLENVGKTLRHHTFFEMLGNFSFGDYFKKEAIAFALEFIIDVLKMDKDKLWVSVFEEDEEAKELWIKAGFLENRIVKLGKEDNFWGPAGDEGACGPCSEIYYDLGSEYSCGSAHCSVGCDCERYLEFWNLVFPQFFQNKDGSRRPLERKGVDTGMGLERLSFLMDKNAKNNYQTDIFKSIIKAIERKASVSYEGAATSSYHVVADHLRALTFALADGILPSNEGRGYVIRRILRRALRFGKKIGFNKPFLYDLVLVVTNEMKIQYSELVDSYEMTIKIIKNEEEQFIKTLSKGLNHLEDAISSAKYNKQTIISGDVIFKLYDTLGLPFEVITEVILENELSVDSEGFQKLMDQQKKQGKSSWKGTSYSLDQIENLLQDKFESTRFQGYDNLETKGIILAIIEKNKLVEQTSDSDDIIVIFDKTVCYAESGGQTADVGEITISDTSALITNVQKSQNGIYLHFVKIQNGVLKVGDKVNLTVERAGRLNIEKNHTTTHILQYALRKYLGMHVKQAGSYVSKDRLRFDFSHTQKIPKDELKIIEQEVNHIILQNLKVQSRILSLDDAKTEEGVLANFGEKYGKEVRVISVGDVSKELCGGTHISDTGLINGFKILSESSVSAGVRRIEAITGKMFIDNMLRQTESLENISKKLKVPQDSILEKYDSLIHKVEELEKKLKQSIRSDQYEMIFDFISEINGIQIYIQGVHNSDASDLFIVLDKIKNQHKSYVAFLGSVADSKISYICAKNTGCNLDCSAILKEVANITGGKGGGNKDMARGGGKDVSNFENSMNTAKEIILKILQ